MAADFQTLAKKIDDDFKKIKGTSFGRSGVYYSVLIDDRLTSITARRTTRISYLIDTRYKDNTYTRLYVEDWQIGVILANLGEAPLGFAKNWLAKVYEGESIGEHKLKFSRPALYDGIAKMDDELLVDIIYLEDTSELPLAVDTGLGFSVNTRAFIDFLCLTLSMEDHDKLRIELTKHCVFADLLTNQNVELIQTILPQLNSVKTVADIENLYTNVRTQKEAEDYDEALFTENISRHYFESLASEL